MKTIALGILLAGSMAFAGSPTVLLKMVSFTESAPSKHILTIDSDGGVELQGGNETARDLPTKIAQLAPQALESVKAKVSRIDPGARLVDSDPNGPVCVDAPAVYMLATQGTQEIRFYSLEGCHIFRLNDGSGYDLIQLLNGLGTLVR